MNFNRLNYLMFLTLSLTSCRTIVEREQTNYQYHDASFDTVLLSTLYAITDEEYLQYGSNIAFVNINGDTLIPLGNYAYYGTDSFKYYTNVILHPNDSTYGRQVGINRSGEILFDLVMYDNGPEPFNEGLTRVLRNGKMGYANEKGEVVIPCTYAYAKWFENGKAEVTFDAIEFYDLDDHLRVESDSWFEIDQQGNPTRTP